ncbi:MAG: lysophospholipase [Candidatus Eiseniibacteriota bacterium]
MTRRLTSALIVILVTALAACAPERQYPGPAVEAPHIDAADGVFVTADDFVLPLREWLPEGKPKAVILALHGMNDHSLAFEKPASEWAKLGIATYAYDQRGFGGSWNRGIWPGVDTLTADLATMTKLVHARQPGVPLYLLGESMGGAVVLTAMAERHLPDVSGAILIAPAVWARDTLPLTLRVSLWLAAHTVPSLELTGQELNIRPTDNIEVLRAMFHDPRVIKATRVDAIYGVVNLMDRALKAAAHVQPPILVLYGEHDQVMPRKPTLEAIERMPQAGVKVALYPKGYHMLLRDLEGETPIRDIEAWLADHAAPLPSGADKRDISLLAREPDDAASRP